MESYEHTYTGTDSLKREWSVRYSFRQEKIKTRIHLVVTPAGRPETEDPEVIPGVTLGALEHATLTLLAAGAYEDWAGAVLTGCLIGDLMQRSPAWRQHLAEMWEKRKEGK